MLVLDYTLKWKTRRGNSKVKKIRHWEERNKVDVIELIETSEQVLIFKTLDSGALQP